MLLHQIPYALVTFSLLVLGAERTHVQKRTFIGDPRRNITCLGSSYDLRLPIRPDGVDLNTLTMQQLCAKPVYGGANIPRSVGGWCSSGLEPAYLDEDDDGNEFWYQDEYMFPTRTGVSFDFTATQWRDVWPETESGQEPIFHDDRLYAGCLNRCFCSWGLDDLTIQPKREVPSNADLITVQIDTSAFTEIKLELADFTRGDRDFYNRIKDGSDISVLQIMHDLGEPNEEGGYAQTHTTGWIEQVELSLDPGNEITCEGELPSFTLPEPYPLSEFANPQQLCAVQWSGGLSGANAGGYCHRSNPHQLPGTSRYDNQVWFSDEMTPRYEYTWGGGNFFLSASLRAYCYAHCYCTSVGKDRTRHRAFTVWQFLRGHQMVFRRVGDSIDYGKRGPLQHGVFQKLGQVLPQGVGAAPYASGTCGADGRQFCPSPWPEAQLGPIPRAPPFTTDIVVAPPSPDPGAKRNLTVCGNQCKGQSDCSPTKEGYGCDCAVPNTEDARFLGLDPVAPPSICLSLNLLAFGAKPLHGRNFGDSGLVDEEGVPYQCKCNATYTGMECCGSRDGIVWLE